MSDEKPAEPLAVDPEQVNPDEKTDAEKPESSFGEMLSQFEESHRKEPGAKQLEGTVISVSADAVYLDIGYKTEGVLARTAFRDNAESVKAGDKFFVSVKGRNEEHYYVLSLARVAQPRDWTQLEEAFAQKLTIPGTVTAVVKGGLSVDVGVRAFMPASRSGTRDARELEKLVGQEITCRITKLDVADENVVVDRRAVLEEQALAEGMNSVRRDQRRRHGERQGAQPGELRRVCGSGRHRRAAARERYFLESRERAGRRAGGGAGDLQVKVLKIDPREPEDFAGAETAAAGAVGDGDGKVQGGRADHRDGDAADGFWRVCGAGAGD